MREVEKENTIKLNLRLTAFLHHEHKSRLVDMVLHKGILADMICEQPLMIRLHEGGSAPFHLIIYPPDSLLIIFLSRLQRGGSVPFHLIITFLI